MIKKEAVVTTPRPKNFYVDNHELYNALLVWLKARRRSIRKKEPLPQLPDYVAECMMKMATRLSQKAGFVNYCVDKKTEMLTKRGWLKWNEVTTDDIALSCDPKDGQLKWGPIHEVFINEHYDGMMFYLTGNGLDALVTPGHKFLTPERGLVKVEQLRQWDHITLMGKAAPAPEFRTYSDAFVELVGWAVTEGSYRIGKNTHGVSISQAKPSGIKNIEQALIETKAFYNKSKWKISKIGKLKCYYFNITGSIANQIVSVSPHRVLRQDFIDKLTYNQRLLLIQTMINGDGWIHKFETGYVGRHYCQKDSKHIDAFLSLCAQTGIRANYYIDNDALTPDGFPTTQITVNLCEGKNTKWGTEVRGCKVENIDFHGSQRDLTNAEHLKGEQNSHSKLTVEKILEAKALNAAGVSYKKLSTKYGVNPAVLHRACTGQSWKHIDGYESLIKGHEASTPYKGVVWCPRTDYGTVVCRRNGRTYTSGNTFRDDMIGDALESCLRYIHNFNPEKSTNAFAYITQIIHNAFIRRIQKEQKQLYVKMRIVDEADFTDSYERQEGDNIHYNNNYVTYLQENKGEVIQKFENWKESKKSKANKKKESKEAKLTGLFEEDEVVEEKPKPVKKMKARAYKRKP